MNNRLNNRLFDALNNIHAEDALKKKTEQYLRAAIEKRSHLSRVYRMRRLATVITSFILLLSIGFFSANLYFAPEAHIDMDVNPSLAVTLNRFGRIIAAEAYNDDGELILQDTAVTHKTYEEAVRLLLETMIAYGFMEQNGLVSITVQADNGEKEASLIEHLESTVSRILVSHHMETSTEIYAVDEDVLASAHDHNMSPAKYLAILKLQDIDHTATFKDCAEHSIGEIRQRTRHHGKNHGGEMTDREENQQKENEQQENEQEGNADDEQTTNGQGHNGQHHGHH